MPFKYRSICYPVSGLFSNSSLLTPHYQKKRLTMEINIPLTEHPY